MGKDELIIRKDLSGRLRHVEYSLSDSCGFAVLRLVNTLTEWGARYSSLLPKPEAITALPGPGGLRVISSADEEFYWTRTGGVF